MKKVFGLVTSDLGVECLGMLHYPYELVHDAKAPPMVLQNFKALCLQMRLGCGDMSDNKSES